MKSLTDDMSAHQIKPMAAMNGIERYRVVFNDSEHFIQAMIAQQLNHVVADGSLKKGCLCRLKEFQASFVKDRPCVDDEDICLQP